MLQFKECITSFKIYLNIPVICKTIKIEVPREKNQNTYKGNNINTYNRGNKNTYKWNKQKHSKGGQQKQNKKHKTLKL